MQIILMHVCRETGVDSRVTPDPELVQSEEGMVHQDSRLVGERRSPGSPNRPRIPSGLGILFGFWPRNVVIF